LPPQPLFIGHAFINPKDIPFLSFFLLSLSSGLRLFDSLEPLPSGGLSLRSRRSLLVLTGLWLASVVGLLAIRDAVHTLLTNLGVGASLSDGSVAFESIKRRALQIALITVCVLPGVIDGVRLHPYEYVDYNRCMGGEPGALRRFQLDYWGTSYREVSAWLNANAPRGRDHLCERSCMRPSVWRARACDAAVVARVPHQIPAAFIHFNLSSSFASG